MKRLQYYVFIQILGPLATILGGLTAIALLTQGLNQLDIIVDERQSALAFAWITVLALPQLLSLILPLAVFFAVVAAINRLQTDSEIVVAYAAGMSNSQIISPVLKLAVLAGVLHMGLNVLVQPASFREMRQTVHELRADVAASLVQEGSFTSPGEGLTLYARNTSAGGAMQDLLIHDERGGERPRTYTARSGAVTMLKGAPALIMRDGQIQEQKPDGSLDVLAFEQYVLQLGEYIERPDVYLLKSSDRFLSELFFSDPTNFYDQRNMQEFIAEGHARIASPLLCVTLALIALAGLLTGDFQRLGYGRRIAVVAVIALTVRLIQLGVTAACADEPDLNWLQYAWPLIAASIAGLVLIRSAPKTRARRGATRAHVTPQAAASPA